MAGGFSASGLITGIDSNTLITQLLQFERQPIFRIEGQISALEAQQEAIRELRTQLTTLRDATQDFRIGNLFDQFATNSTDENILTVSANGPNPVSGSFLINVLQVASATTASSSASLGSPINPGAFLDVSGISESISTGTFSINGQSIVVDPSNSSLNDVIGAINASGAGVTASYDALTDRVTIANTTPGDTNFINFGASGDTSNFLDVIGVQSAAQLPGGGGETTVVGNRSLGAVNSGNVLNVTSFAGGAVTAGTFLVNGISITVDPTTDTLEDVIARINGSDAGVSASYDQSTDSIRVVSENLGSPTINFQSGTSNFLDVTNLTTATQVAGNDSQFTINGGPVQTRNTNNITDAIPDITLNLVGLGAATVGVETDDEAIIESVREFVTAFNESIAKIEELLGDDGALENDSSIRTIASTLRSSIFEQIGSPLSGIESLLNVGITSGESFDASAIFKLEIDETELRNAILNDRAAVANVFTNDDGNGVLDSVFEFLDGVTGTTGFLNERASASGSIDRQIDIMNDRIERMEARLEVRERRLRAQFARLEVLTAQYQSQASSLLSLGGGASAAQ